MCWVAAPRRGAVAATRDDGSRMACSACQFVASTSGRVTQVKSAGRSVRRCWRRRRRGDGSRGRRAHDRCARLQATERHPQSVHAERPARPPAAQRQRAQQQAADRVGEARGPALRRLEQVVRAAQEVREAGLVRGVRELAVGRPAVAHEDAGIARAEDRRGPRPGWIV